MQSLIWILILVVGPPCLALILWQGIGVGSRTGNIVPWQYVRMGKYGFWIMLAIIYAVSFTAALIEHKI